MHCIDIFESPLGNITLSAQNGKLCGLWFEGQKYDKAGLAADTLTNPDEPVFKQAKAWLSAYFEGRDPGSIPEVELKGTAFQNTVWKLLAEIPYGSTTTYGQLGAKVAKAMGKERTSARAVGGAVGKNPISIILPCHRVMGASKSLTGYAGGIARKKTLLELEGFDTTLLTTPTKGTAL